MKRQTKLIQFKVLIEQYEDGWYVGSVPELPGCYTQAKTLEELRKRIREVIELVLDTDKEVREDKLKRRFPYPGFFGVEDIQIQYA